MERFEVRIWGARGTLPAAGPEYGRYGGDTSCIEVALDDRIVILDAGSGLVPLGRDLMRRETRRLDIAISHAHLDHLLGLPFFAPLFQPGWTVTLWYAGNEAATDGADLLDTMIRPPFLPFTRAAFRCDLRIRALPRAGQVGVGAGARLSTCQLNHPGGNTGLRIDHRGRAFAYCCDFEQDGGAGDAALTGLLGGADLALLDATYTPEEYDLFRGFGHSHWRACAALAGGAGVDRWGLFHHAPDRTDATLDRIAAAARAADPRAFAARQGQIIDLMAPDTAASPANPIP